MVHLPSGEHKEVMCKTAAVLKAAGIIYASFKYGTFTGERPGLRDRVALSS